MEINESTATTILVTGSTGNIGREVLKQLSNFPSNLNLKAAVRSVDASTVDNGKNSFGTKNDVKRVQQVVMDFDRLETIVEGLKSVDKLFVVTPTHPKMVEFTSSLADVANAAEYLAGDLSAFVSGQHLLVTGCTSIGT